MLNKKNIGRQIYRFYIKTLMFLKICCKIVHNISRNDLITKKFYCPQQLNPAETYNHPRKTDNLIIFIKINLKVSQHHRDSWKVIIFADSCNPNTIY